MPRAANDVMQSVLFSAVLDAIAALKANSGGLANNIVRDVGAIHANVTFADLPKPVQDAIVASTRTAFTQLLKEGYSVAPSSAVASTRPPPRRGEEVGRGQNRSPRPPAGRGPRPGGDRPPGDRPGGNRPGGDRPGGDRPGGNRPGGNRPGGDRPRGPRKP